MTTVAGGAGAAALTASVVVPISLARGSSGSDASGVTAAHHGRSPHSRSSIGQQCELVRTIKTRHGSGGLTRLNAGRALDSAKTRLGPTNPGGRYEIETIKHGGRTSVFYCVTGQSVAPGHTPPPNAGPSPGLSPTAPAYTYSDDPQAISSRLGSNLTDQVRALGLTINYTRPFSQETATLDSGHPDYFGGNVDVHEGSGYGDIGVQVTHASTEQTPLTGTCTPTGPSQCQQTTLADGSILRTARLHAGPHNLILTAEVARPDGVLVQAQESNYAFGPDAGTEAHGGEPLTLDQLTTLAEDPEFTF
jgi:hypothetical protein